MLLWGAIKALMGFWGSQGGVRRRASINILFNTVFWGVRGEGGWDMRNLAMVLKLLPGFFIGVWGVVGGAGWDGWGLVFFGRWGRVWTVINVENSACVPRFPRFILLVSFSHTLLVVSILDSL